MMSLEITGLSSSSGPLTKRISLAQDGSLVRDGSACVMARGQAWRVRLDGLPAFASLIGSLGQHEAITLGSLRADLPDAVQVTTAEKLAALNGTAPADLIARTAAHIEYAAGQQALALLDHDSKGMPPRVRDRLVALGGLWSAIVSVAPDLAHVAKVVRRSTSSGLSRSDTGASIPGSDGVHIFLLVQDGEDIERFLKVLHDRCWLHGLGWMMVGASGQLLNRSIVDRSVFAAERLVFEGAPILEAPVVQDVALRVPQVSGEHAVDTVAACRSLTIVENAKLKDLHAAERHRLGGQAAEVRRAFVKTHGAALAARTGMSLDHAQRIVERHCGGVLLPAVVLPFDAADLTGATVGDVLADPDRFVGATLADPLEGVAYGQCKARIMRRPDGSLWINSFAHGRTTYEMKYDAATVEAAVAVAEPADAADAFVRLAVLADLTVDEQQHLREIASQRSGVKARPMAAKLKQAKGEQAQQRAQAENDRARAARTDRRVHLPAPAHDDERVPVLEALDEVLCSVVEPEPPMRDLDGHPVEVRERQPMEMHELTASGTNGADVERTRLPPPTMPLLTKHDRYSFAHEIERHIEYSVSTLGGGVRSVALSPVFIDHCMAFRDSAMPRVGAVVTAPVVLPNGTMLASAGLDRQRKLVFRIPPELLAILPAFNEPAPSDKRVAEAFSYLVDTWLCDVAADFAGKCVLVAMALTILERVLLPERPAFFVTAGKRGGGKTTALAMIIMAITGKKPAAAAWSPSEEERRKALVAYLSEGLAAVVFDNIPLGTAISCPTIEKVLTAETYSDRILGQTAIATVPSVTVLAFTGNNIAPRGDMASRSLVARLDVDRPDPENRKFKHGDPIAWTVENRGVILRALYVVLLGNPQLREPKPAKTRFKGWWHLVGSAVEHAAACLVEVQTQLEPKKQTAKLVDFGRIFASVEEVDEETSTLADVLGVLHGRSWPSNSPSFQSSDVARLINQQMVGEEEEAATLRAFFDPTGRRSGDFTSIVIGRRLGTITDAPVRVGDKTLKLTRSLPGNQSEQRVVAQFKIVEVGALPAG